MVFKNISQWFCSEAIILHWRGAPLELLWVVRIAVKLYVVKILKLKWKSKKNNKIKAGLQRSRGKEKKENKLLKHYSVQLNTIHILVTNLYWNICAFIAKCTCISILFFHLYITERTGRKTNSPLASFISLHWYSQFSPWLKASHIQLVNSAIYS